MRKPQIQPSLASLSLAEREQLADWLRHGEYHDVLARVNQPRPEGFGLAIASIKPLWTFHAKVALFDLINSRLSENKKISFATFESLARRDIDLLTSAENESLAAAHASILRTVADLATSGDNSTTQLLHLQRLADFPARAELREHKIQMDLARKDFTQQRLEIQKRHLALAEKLAEQKLADSNSKLSTKNSKPAESSDALGPLAKNWEDVRERARKAFGITPEESARRAELRRTWVDPNAHLNDPAPDSVLAADPSCQADVDSEAPATVLPSSSNEAASGSADPITPITPITEEVNAEHTQSIPIGSIGPIGPISETTNPPAAPEPPEPTHPTPAPLTRDQLLAEFYNGMAAQARELFAQFNANRAKLYAENQNQNHEH